jgi:glycine dehydrogenase
MNLFEKQSAEFAARHIGPDKSETAEMLANIGLDTMNELIDKTIPKDIRLQKKLNIGEPMS